MSQVATVLARVDHMTHGANALQVSASMTQGWMADDDDQIDTWLASLSVNEFEHIMSVLEDLG
jgi:hypothetical protein